MFGYVKTDIPNMYVKDTVLYKSAYCGLCKSIGKECGNIARFTLNYDLTFLSLFVHCVTGTDIKIKRERCAVHWLIKRPVAVPDAISGRIADLNLILAYYKLTDDVNDENKGKFKRALFIKAYKKAKIKEPALDKIVKENYLKLAEYEKSGGDSIDISADPFGNMLKEISVELLKESATEDIKNLTYNLGKWIYLIDAADDFDKDKKKGSFNVFVNLYKDAENKEELLKKHGRELETVFGTVISDVSALSGKIDYKFNHDLIDNVLFCGLTAQTKKVLENKKCKNITKS